MTFDVFYCCYGSGKEVPGSDPIRLSSDQIWRLAQRILAAPDDFFGIVDSSETTLQVMVDAEGSYWTEVPAPRERGSYGATLTQAQLRELLQHLPPSFGATLVPGACFEAW